MNEKTERDVSPADTLKNESARQRWELFHRAIAHAKAANMDDMLVVDEPAEGAPAVPFLTIAR